MQHAMPWPARFVILCVPLKQMAYSFVCTNFLFYLCAQITHIIIIVKNV